VRDAVIAGTIVTKSYLPFARVLARSLREHHPDLRLVVALVDEPEGMFDPRAEPFEVLPITSLGIPDLRRVCFQYDGQRVSIVAKPYLLRYLLDLGFSAALFLDADILVLDRLTPVLTAVAKHAIVLTPHLIDHLSGDEAIWRELNILQSGVYNGGVIGVSETASAHAFLTWLGDRLRMHCRHDVRRGMHWDQWWLDLAGSMFDDVFIVRDAGCNVAYWNLPERYAQTANDGQAPWRFFHFSGFRPEKPRRVTSYSSRVTMETIGTAATLFDQYAERLYGEGYQASKLWPYTYGCFDNGVPIPDAARKDYLELEAPQRFGDPFQASTPESYFRWLNEPVAPSASPITHLWDAVYRSRLDLQRAFPDVFGAHADPFQEWIFTHGLEEHAISTAFAGLSISTVAGLAGHVART
jgi:hypothetical protein